MKETGLYDPVMEVDEIERHVFGTAFPAIWFSLHRLQDAEGGLALMAEIVRTNPAGTPDFDAWDLWLQRKTALLLYDRAGLEPFLKKGCRASLLYYLHAKRVFSEAQFAVIRQAMESLPEDAFSDDYCILPQWLDEGANGEMK
jgi:hypothetical protein